MICVDCGKLRHTGPCDPIDEDYELEILAADAEMATERLLAAVRKRNAEGQQGKVMQ